MSSHPPTACKFVPGHLPLVTYRRRARDLFRTTYWVRCLACDLMLGPFDSEGAHQRRLKLERAWARL